MGLHVKLFDEPIKYNLRKWFSEAVYSLVDGGNVVEYDSPIFDFLT